MKKMKKVCSIFKNIKLLTIVFPNAIHKSFEKNPKDLFIVIKTLHQNFFNINSFLIVLICLCPGLKMQL